MTWMETVLMTDEARLLAHCAPIFFVPSANARPESISANATVGLIDTGQKNLLVTSAHVWTEFQDLKLKNPEARLGTIFANGRRLPEFLNEELLVAYDTDLDLVVFNSSPSWNIGLKEFYKVCKWPISKTNVGDRFAALGFAGVGRETATGIGRFNYSCFGSIVASVSDRKFLVENSDNPAFDRNGNILRKVSIGGMSGSPAYILNDQGNFRLVGFIQMGATTDDPIFVTHAYFLNQDGTLKRQ